MQEFGIPSVTIQSMDVLLSFPRDRKVEIVFPLNQSFTATLKEPAYPLDPTSNDTSAVPTFNGYSPSGNVTAEVVYVNYGTLDDFQRLQTLGVNVTGKIVLVRYGSVFRGVKAFIAELFGAVGVLIYSDPKDDGFVRGTTFPYGPWRPEEGVQRGSLAYLNLCAGEPSPQRKEMCLGQGNKYKNLSPTIPVQPLSWGDAQEILKALEGNAVPQDWQGGLNFTYRVGPGPAVVHLYTQMDFNITTIWNVIGTIAGESDNMVILGNHRDAWVFGAVDPSSVLLY